eukprot:scaffold187724_cov35-Tisochrysis_lutea.AAC.3
MPMLPKALKRRLEAAQASPSRVSARVMAASVASEACERTERAVALRGSAALVGPLTVRGNVKWLLGLESDCKIRERCERS